MTGSLTKINNHLTRTVLHMLRILFIVLLLSLGAKAQFSADIPFTGASEPNVIMGGAAQLTAASAIDVPGSGWLRLTTLQSNSRGFAYVDQSFPSDLGFVVEFEFAIWNKGGIGAADGFSVFMFDGSTPSFSPGQYGGGLGYATAYTNNTRTTISKDGVSGGYVGVGFDVYGNYSNPADYFKIGGTVATPNAIAIRGTTAQGTPFLGSAPYELGALKLNDATATTRPLPGNYFRKVRMLIEPNPSSGIGSYQITVWLQKSQTGAMEKILGPFDIGSAPPPTMKLGFTASTGSGWEYHEIRNLKIHSPGSVSISKSVNKTEAYNGENIIYTLHAKNLSQNILRGVKVSDIVPSDINVTSIGINGVPYPPVNNLEQYIDLMRNADSVITIEGTLNTRKDHITNTAHITTAPGFYDSDPDDNDASASFHVLPVASASDEIICTGETTNIPLSSDLDNTSFTWKVIVPNSNISGYSDGTGNTIGQTLSNTTSIPQKIKYEITPVSSRGKTGRKDTITVTVNPAITPAITISSDKVQICENESVTFNMTIENSGTAPQYQWKVNNISIASATTETFSTTTLQDGDIITCIMTPDPDAGCLTATTATSNAITITVNPLLDPAISIATPDNTICADQSGVFNSSINNGGTNPQYQWKINNTAIDTATNNSFFPTSLQNGDVVECILTPSADAGCLVATAANSNNITMTVNPLLNPTIAIATPDNTICADQSGAFNSSINNGGTNPQYQWKINNTAIDTATNSSFYPATLHNGDIITCIVTPSADAGCLAATTATSNNIAMTVNPLLNPTIAIATPDNTICADQSGAFNSSINNGGTNPQYQWKINNTAIDTATNSSFYPATLHNGDIITCIVTPSADAGCLAATTATSNNISMTVNPLLNPTIAIATPDNTICADQSGVFNSSINNGGTNPQYQWKINNTAIDTATNSSFFPATLHNGDIIECILTPSADAGCLAATAATSNNISMTVNPLLNPTIAIATPDNTICADQSGVFNSSINNGGTNPQYQWKINNTAIDTATNSSFFPATLHNGDIITCIVTPSADAGCLAATAATSNNIAMTVNPLLNPTIAIATPDNTICADQSGVFNSSINNGGTNPQYQWKINNTAIDTATNSSFFPATLHNGDIITCIVTPSADAGCLAATAATSNNIAMTVNPLLNPTIAIATPDNTICADQSGVFNSSINNGGTNPQYQWKINNTAIDTATNSSFYPASMQNGDVVECILTPSADAGCLAATAATSNNISMTVNPLLNPTIAIAAPKNVICDEEAVTFTPSINNGGTNPQYQWKVNNTPVGTGDIFTSGVLQNGDIITCILTPSADAGCLAATSATSNNITMTVNPLLNPTIAIATPKNVICDEESVTFTPSVNNGGTNPQYQWKVNNSPVAATGNSFTSATLQNGDIVACILTPSADVGCLAATSATSNNITMTVNPLLNPTIAIATPKNDVCAQEFVTFTPSINHGGTNPQFQWKVNNTSIGSGDIFTSNALQNGDIIECILTPSADAGCLAATSANSNNIVMTVNPLLNPTISIATPKNIICAQESVTFTPSINNGGANPQYQWKVNNTPVGTVTGETFTSTTLQNGDIVDCILTPSADAGCLTATTATSNNISMKVNPLLNPAITISTPNNNICAGAPASFNSIINNGGTNPQYQWKVNNIAITATGNNFSSATLQNGDMVECIMTPSADAGCLATASANSNNIFMIVNPLLDPAIAIATPKNVICAGESVAFNSTVNNAGTSPQYQWKVNNTPVATTGNHFTSATLQNGDIVECILTPSADAGCLAATSANSNNIAMTVNPLLDPAIAISTPGNDICAGESVVFSSTISNGGANPQYQWRINNTSVSTTGNNFTSTSLQNGDIIECILTPSADAGCLSATQANSNNIAMTVNPLLHPAVIIATSVNDICFGESVVFTSTINNGGTNPQYQWKINNTPITTTGNSFTSATLQNGDIVECILTPDSDLRCPAAASAASNNIAMIVNPMLDPAITISAAKNTICAGESVVFSSVTDNGGTNPQYQWKVNNTPVAATGNSFTSATLQNGDIIECTMTPGAEVRCLVASSATSNNIPMKVNPLLNPGIIIEASKGEICAGESVAFSSTTDNGGTNPQYQWKLNNMAIGTGETFTSATLQNGDIVECILTPSTDAGCLAVSTANSNNISMIVNPLLHPAISIATPKKDICAGETVVFNTTTSNGGANPQYQWKVNNTAMTATGSSFTSATFKNGDVITCIMTPGSDVGCLADPLATSNGIQMNVARLMYPQISIASPDSVSCENRPASFSAFSTDGGINPSYQWYINGRQAGTGKAFSSASLNNNDLVSCIITIDPVLLCPGRQSAESNKIAITRLPVTTPAVSIAADIHRVCAGSNVQFTASPNEEEKEANPAYLWKINGRKVQLGPSNIFTTSKLKDNDLVSCEMTSKNKCVTSPQALSNAVSIAVEYIPVVRAGNDVSIIAGTETTLNGYVEGVNVIYRWTPATGLSNDRILNPIARPSASTTYQLEAQTPMGCKASANVEIRIVHPVRIPNTFSPNGDGINDRWEILHLEDYPGATIQVFNRNGSMIYLNNNYSPGNGWDGRFKGQSLPFGVYYYIIDLKNGSPVFSGSITILR